MKVLIRKSQRPPVDVLIQYSQKLPTVKQVAKDRVKTDPDLAPYQGVLLNDFGIDADDLTGKYQFWDWVANAPKPELLNMARGVDATDSTERLKGNHRFVRPDDKEIPAIKSEVGASAEPYNAFYVRDGINGGYDSVWGVPGENPIWTDNYQAYKLKSRTPGAKDKQPRKRRGTGGTLPTQFKVGARKPFVGASGLRGSSSPLQHEYDDFDEFKDYSEMYGLHKRLGFKSAEDAWKANPRVGHTTEPSDYAIVKSDADDYTPDTAKSAGELVEKREFDTERRETLADEGKALPDGSFPIVNGKDLANAVKAIGRAKNPEKAKAHIKARARALGLTDQLPEEWKTEKSESMPDGSFTILSAKDLEDALALINRAADPATVKAHIIRRSIALDLIDKLPDGWVKKNRTVGAKDKVKRKPRSDAGTVSTADRLGSAMTQREKNIKFNEAMQTQFDKEMIETPPTKDTAKFDEMWERIESKYPRLRGRLDRDKYLNAWLNIPRPAQDKFLEVLGGMFTAKSETTVVTELEPLVEMARTVGAKDKQPRKRRYSIEPKINAYAGSADYGKPYGLNLIDNAKNEKVTSVLLHDWKNLYAYKLDKDTQKELEDYATKHLSDETPEDLLGRVQDAHEEAAQAQEALNKMGASTPYDAMSRERREAYDRTAKWAGELWQRHDALKQRYTSMKKSMVEMARTNDPKRAAEKGWQTRRAHGKVGDRFKVSDTAGLSSGKQGVIVHPSMYKNPNSGMNINMDWKTHHAIKYDEGGDVDALPKAVIGVNTASLEEQHAENIRQAEKHERYAKSSLFDKYPDQRASLMQRATNLRNALSNNKPVSDNPLKSVKVIGPQGQQGTLDDVLKGVVRLVSRRSPLAKSDTSEDGE